MVRAAAARLEKPASSAHSRSMQQLAVPRRLERFVRAMRVVEVPAATPEAAPEHYRRLPDGETELIVRFGDEPTSATVIGTRTFALTKPATRGASALLVRFRLGGAHPFFGRPLSELTDRVVELEHLWTAQQLAQLAEARGAAAVEAAVVSALAAVFTGAQIYDPMSARCVRRAVQRIAEHTRLPRVPQLAAEIGVSERQLRRGFDHVIGLSPKHYLRIVRFRRALRAARQLQQRGRLDWAAVAEAHGYFDQAHLIAEFREMAGATPTSLVG
jgi:AraC-like DNA-binding protein